MPILKNLEYKKFHQDKLIDLYTEEHLAKWLEAIPNVKKPRKATFEYCRALLIILFYLGARPAEIISLKPKDIEYKVYETINPKTGRKKKVRVYEITIKTLKHGEKMRVLPIPVNDFTKELYINMKKQFPEMYYFWAFKSRNGGIAATVKWKTTKTIYVRENGVLNKEEITEEKSKLYYQEGNLINKYITSLTGKPPYFFRHHRISYMLDKGATDQQAEYWKGGGTLEAYKNLSTRAKQEYPNFF